MKLILAAVAVGLARLTLASGVVAQVVDVERAEPVPPRIEVGASVGTTSAFPELGAVFSVPVDRRLAVEVMVSRMQAAWEYPANTLAQVQLRTPFRADLRSRKSVVVGVTRVVADDGERGILGGSDDGTLVRPHAGVSLQWPTGPAFDLRVDFHGLITFSNELPLVPRAVVGFVWHPRTGRRSGRSPRCPSRAAGAASCSA
jgi:hypothetical protein